MKVFDRIEINPPDIIEDTKPIFEIKKTNAGGHIYDQV